MSIPPSIIVLVVGIVMTLIGIIYRSMVRRIEAVEEETEENTRELLRGGDED